MTREHRALRSQILADYATRFAGVPVKTIGRRLHKDHPELWVSVKSGYDAIAGKLGLIGKRSRQSKGNAKFWRKPSKPGYAPPPPSIAEDYVPFEIGPGRVLVLSDIHVPYHDSAALEAALAHGDTYQPDVVLLNGDTMDFYSPSRHETNPKKRDLEGELKAGFELLKHVRTRFPKSRMVFKLGNHEERWDSYLFTSAALLVGIPHVDLAFVLTNRIEDSQTVERIEGIEFVGERRMISAGKLPILHGHEFPKGLASPVNPARGAFMRGMECSLSGHLHRTSEHTEPTMLGRFITTWSTGCLCDLHPLYARVNKWNHGFATIDVAKSGDFSVNNFRIRHGKVL